jgi:HKD family nuclease
MYACDIIPFHWPRKENKENTSKNLLYPKTLSHTSPQNLHHTYLYKKCYCKYSICATPLHSKSYFFIVQFKAHGKVAVYGDYHLCKLHV